MAKWLVSRKLSSVASGLSGFYFDRAPMESTGENVSVSSMGRSNYHKNRKQYLKKDEFYKYVSRRRTQGRAHIKRRQKQGKKYRYKTLRKFYSKSEAKKEYRKQFRRRK